MMWATTGLDRAFDLHARLAKDAAIERYTSVKVCVPLCRLRDVAAEFADATCLAMACPACMTLELAQSCSGYVTTIINNTDVVPTISPGK